MNTRQRASVAQGGHGTSLRGNTLIGTVSKEIALCQSAGPGTSASFYLVTNADTAYISATLNIYVSLFGQEVLWETFTLPSSAQTAVVYTASGVMSETWIARIVLHNGTTPALPLQWSCEAGGEEIVPPFTLLQIPVGTSGQVLTTVSGVATWQTPSVPIVYSECVFVAGNATTQSNTTWMSIGARSFDTTKFPSTIGTLSRYVVFLATLENTANATSTLVQLYDVRNSIVVSGTSLNSSSSTSQVLPYDVTSVALTLGTTPGNIIASSPGMYEAQIQMVGGVAGVDASTCTNARLVVYYA